LDDQDGGWVSVSSGTGSRVSPGQSAVKRLLLCVVCYLYCLIYVQLLNGLLLC